VSPKAASWPGSSGGESTEYPNCNPETNGSSGAPPETALESPSNRRRQMTESVLMFDVRRKPLALIRLPGTSVRECVEPYRGGHQSRLAASAVGKKHARGMRALCFPASPAVIAPRGLNRYDVTSGGQGPQQLSHCGRGAGVASRDRCGEGSGRARAPRGRRVWDAPGSCGARIGVGLRHEGWSTASPVARGSSGNVSDVSRH